MQFCLPHWNKLRELIEQRGLMHLVPKSKDKAITSIVSEANDLINPKNFDPLMYAHWAMISSLLGVSKELLYLEGCPVCIANKFHYEGCKDPLCRRRTAFYDEWLERAADDAKVEWEKLQL